MQDCLHRFHLKKSLRVSQRPLALDAATAAWMSRALKCLNTLHMRRLQALLAWYADELAGEAPPPPPPPPTAEQQRLQRDQRAAQRRGDAESSPECDPNVTPGSGPTSPDASALRALHLRTPQGRAQRGALRRAEQEEGEQAAAPAGTEGAAEAAQAAARGGVGGSPAKQLTPRKRGSPAAGPGCGGAEAAGAERATPRRRGAGRTPLRAADDNCGGLPAGAAGATPRSARHAAVASPGESTGVVSPLQRLRVRSPAAKRRLGTGEDAAKVRCGQAGQSLSRHWRIRPIAGFPKRALR